MLTAITRAVSPAINLCEIGYIERQAINLAEANRQHGLYEVSELMKAEAGVTCSSLLFENYR
jgi:hypothetical protein